MTRFLKNIYKENVKRIQFIPNISFTYLHMSSIFRYYNPPMHYLSACPPDQLPPDNFTLLPVLSTIFIPFVDKGNFILSTSNNGVYDLNYFCSFEYFYMNFSSW